MFVTNLLHHLEKHKTLLKSWFRLWPSLNDLVSQWLSDSVPGRFRGNGLQDGVVIQADPQHSDLVILIASYRNEPKEFPQYSHITVRCFTLHQELDPAFLVHGLAALILNQISNSCLDVASPCCNVQKSLMSHLQSRGTPKALRYPMRSISTPQWGISWHPGTWICMCIYCICMWGRWQETWCHILCESNCIAMTKGNNIQIVTQSKSL